MKTVWNIKKTILEFLVKSFLHVANYHIYTLWTTTYDLEKLFGGGAS